jgi:hypothetical protein
MNYKCMRYACGILYGDKHIFKLCMLRVTNGNGAKRLDYVGHI